MKGIEAFSRRSVPLISSQNLMEFRADILDGLSRTPKALPCKYFYDEIGSELFDRICEQPEYYQTRIESEILRQFGMEIARAVGEDILLVEYGSGSSQKTRILLNHLETVVAYLPIDISAPYLRRSCDKLRSEYPKLRIMPVVGDYTKLLRLPLSVSPTRRVFFFPGSTIGNLDEPGALRLLDKTHDLAGPGGGLLIGIDLKKDREPLEFAYNDGQGITEKFNLNLLHRINTELGANFSLSNFAHRAFYREEMGRVEMHLQSLSPQAVTIDGSNFRFFEGETIHTENSYKYSLEQFEKMGVQAGFRLRNRWTDPKNYFAVLYLEARY